MGNVVAILLCVGCGVFAVIGVIKLIQAIKDYKARKKPNDIEKGE